MKLKLNLKLSFKISFKEYKKDQKKVYVSKLYLKSLLLCFYLFPDHFDKFFFFALLLNNAHLLIRVLIFSVKMFCYLSYGNILLYLIKVKGKDSLPCVCLSNGPGSET